MSHLVSLLLFTTPQTSSVSLVVPTQFRTHQIVSNSWLLNLTVVRSCQCMPGFAKNFTNRFEFLFDCVQCPPNNSVTRDGGSCLPCGGTSVYNETLKACVCPNGFKVVSTANDGSLLTSFQCQQCPPN